MKLIPRTVLIAAAPLVAAATLITAPASPALACAAAAAPVSAETLTKFTSSVILAGSGPEVTTGRRDSFPDQIAASITASTSGPVRSAMSS